METAVEDLVQQAKDGSKEALESLVRRIQDRVYGLALRMLGYPADAEDAAQEAFAVACRDIGSLKSKERFAAWLVGICRNVSRQMLRTRMIKPASLSDDCAAPTSEKDTGARREMIRRAVWTLRETERELIVLRYFDGFSQARISEVLGISPQAVNGRLVRAKRKIAKHLKRNGLTGDGYGTS